MLVLCVAPDEAPEEGSGLGSESGLGFGSGLLLGGPEKVRLRAALHAERWPSPQFRSFFQQMSLLI